MTFAPSFSRIRAAVVALSAFGLVGCISEMPRQLPSAPRWPVNSPFVPTFIPIVSVNNVQQLSVPQSNRIKYRDAGIRSVRLRVGAVALEARALLAKDGSTLIEASTAGFEGGIPAGIIEKLQLKPLTANPFTLNETPNAEDWAHTVAGLVTGDQLQIQANVKGFSGSKVEVLRLGVTVARRPDIAVMSLDGPASANSGTPVTFFAAVGELNGDMGARADCELTVNGTPVDAATGIWVDARDVVNCQFSYNFENTGTYTIGVSATNVNPGDWDDANNSATRTISIVAPGTPIAFGQMSAQDDAYTYSYQGTRTGPYPITANSGGSEMRSYINVYGTSVTPVPAPVQRVIAKVTTGSTVIYETQIAQLTTFQYNSGGGVVRCSDFNLNGQTAQSCTTTYPNGTGNTWFSYAHSSGTVTYYGLTQYCGTFGCNTFTNNGSRLTGWSQRYGVSAGSPLRVQLTFVDGAGENRVIDRTVTMQDFSGPVNYDISSCAPYWDGLGDLCTRRISTGTVLKAQLTW